VKIASSISRANDARIAGQLIRDVIAIEIEDSRLSALHTRRQIDPG
jgi:hypothetical protein